MNYFEIEQLIIYYKFYPQIYKGFHIAIPFECFPKEINNIPTTKQFPKAARIVAEYIVDYITDKYQFKNEIIEIEDKKYTISDIETITEKPFSELVNITCADCKKQIKQIEKKYVFICGKCEATYDANDMDEFMNCEKCKNFIGKKHQISTKNKDQKYCTCNSKKQPITKFNILNIVDVDTILISSRHLYRGVYSFNEKSGLVSAPFNHKKIDKFEKEFCKPENIKISNFKFLDRENAVPDEATNLFNKAFHSNDKKTQKNIINEEHSKHIRTDVEYEEIENEIPFEFFPPCILKGLEGLEDGKKRFMFVLQNFLCVNGYSYERIEEIMIEWNKKNPEQLRDTILLGQTKHAKLNKKKILPPNCDSEAYYMDLAICNKDNLCQKIKNPVNYTKRKSTSYQKEFKKQQIKEKNNKNKKE